MLPSANFVTLFLASPGDVMEEREAARAIIDEVNRTSLDDYGLIFRVVGWDTHSFPEYGGDGQAIVNAQIAEMAKYQLFVGIMRDRVGTPTPRALSGTVEEFDLAEQSWKSHGQPDIMFYFGQHSAVPVGGDQRALVDEFRKRVAANALVAPFRDAANFKDLFRGHLRLFLSQRKWAKEPRTATAHASMQNGSWLLLGNRFFRCDSLVDDGSGKIVAHLPEPGPEAEALLKSYQGQRWGRSSVPYAHDNDGATVQVDTAERTSTGGKAVWTVTATRIQNEHSTFHEFSMNGVSADEIAEMRARLLLLGEKPNAGHDVAIMMNMGTGNRRGGVEPVLPLLWSNFDGTVEEFPACARLWAIYHLKVTNTVEHVFELEIGEVEDGKVAVKFRGQRASGYSEKTFNIEISGTCRLE